MRLFDRTDYRKAKGLIDEVDKDGGFIMAPRGMVDESKPELIKAWFDFTKEYGRYC